VAYSPDPVPSKGPTYISSRVQNPNYQNKLFTQQVVNAELLDMLSSMARAKLIDARSHHWKPGDLLKCVSDKSLRLRAERLKQVKPGRSRFLSIPRSSAR